MFSKITAWGAGAIPELRQCTFSLEPADPFNAPYALPEGLLVADPDSRGLRFEQGIINCDALDPEAAIGPIIWQQSKWRAE